MWFFIDILIQDKNTNVMSYKMPILCTVSGHTWTMNNKYQSPSHMLGSGKKLTAINAIVLIGYLITNTNDLSINGHSIKLTFNKLHLFYP